MPEEPMSPGEVARIIVDIKADLGRLNAKLDGWRDSNHGELDALRAQVLATIHETAENTKDIAELRADRKADAVKQENRRWMIYLALIVAILSFVSQLYFDARPGP